MSLFPFSFSLIKSFSRQIFARSRDHLKKKQKYFRTFSRYSQRSCYRNAYHKGSRDRDNSEKIKKNDRWRKQILTFFPCVEQQNKKTQKKIGVKSEKTFSYILIPHFFIRGCVLMSVGYFWFPYTHRV